MNLSRALAESLTSLSRTNRLLHPLALLQSSLYSTSTTKPKRTVAKKPTKSSEESESFLQLEDLPLPSQLDDLPLPLPRPSPSAPPSSQHLGFDNKVANLPKNDLGSQTVWERPSQIPWQKPIVNLVNLIGSVAMPVQFEQSSDGKFWAGTVLTQEQSQDTAALWIPIIFEGDLAHTVAFHLKEKDLVHVSGQLTGDPSQFVMEDGKSSIQVMVQNINFIKESYKGTKIHTSPDQDVQASKVSARMGKRDTTTFWRDLVDNPNHWSDHRKQKASGQVNPKFPDFKHKDSRQALWLDSAPNWVFSKLEELVFDEPRKTNDMVHEPIQQKEFDGPKKSNDWASKEDSWKSVVENPNKWWDNRAEKRNPRYPDFKHKDTGEALWLDSLPASLQSKLPPVKSSFTR